MHGKLILPIGPILAGIGRDPAIESDFVYRSPPRSLNLMRMTTVLPFGLDWETCDRARLTRDPAFDGVFFTGVRTTRIYCRPVCGVRPAKSENVRFFATAAAAERAGFRPCLRCRPEAAPGSPAWNGTATTVARGMRLIEEGIPRKSLGRPSRRSSRDRTTPPAAAVSASYGRETRAGSPRRGAYRQQNGSSIRPRCRYRRSPSPLASVASGGSMTHFARLTGVHHPGFAGPRSERKVQPRRAGPARAAAGALGCPALAAIFGTEPMVRFAVSGPGVAKRSDVPWSRPANRA